MASSNGSVRCIEHQGKPRSLAYASVVKRGSDVGTVQV